MTSYKCLNWLTCISRHYRMLMAFSIIISTARVHGQDASTQSVTLVYGSGSWGTLANLFFLLSAIFMDVLHIRVMLVLAYLCLLLEICLGYPNLSNWSWTSSANFLQLGNIVWFGVTLVLQVAGLIVLLLDEVPARLTGDDEMLWRLFYRRCGITKREFSHILKLGRWQQFRAGDLIEHRCKDAPKAYIVFKGQVALTSTSNIKPTVTLASGQLVNLYLLNLFGIYIGFEDDADHRDLLIAKTDVTLFSWDVPALLAMASGQSSVAVPTYWRSFVLHFMAQQYHRQQLDTPPYCSFGTPEPDPDAWSSGTAMTVDFTDPLRPEEQHKFTWKSVLHFLFGSISLKVPNGLRHHANPKTGALATARVLLAAHMRQRRQTLPTALSTNLDTALSLADQSVVRHFSDVFQQEQQHKLHQHHSRQAKQQQDNKPSGTAALRHEEAAVMLPAGCSDVELASPFATGNGTMQCG